MSNLEIIKIDNRGFLGEYVVGDSHERTLRKIYGSYDKDVMEILYNANINGDILFMIENAGLAMWFPSSIIEKQKIKVIGGYINA